MNEPGEPDTVNPSVRFDEWRVRDGHWPLTPLNPSAPPTLLNETLCASASLREIHPLIDVLVLERMVLRCFGR